MSRDVSHSEAMELLPEAALDALPPDDQAGVVAHATGCPECGPALIALRDAVAQMAFAAPPVTVDAVRRARVRTRLMARARADLSVASTPLVAGERADGPGGGAPPWQGTGEGVRLITGRGGPYQSDAPRRSWAAAAALGWGLAIAAGLTLAVVQRRAAYDERFFTNERRVLLARVDALRDSVESRDTFVRSVTGKHIVDATDIGRSARGVGVDVLGSRDQQVDTRRARSPTAGRGAHVSTVARDTEGEDQCRDIQPAAGRCGRSAGDLRARSGLADRDRRDRRAGWRRAATDWRARHFRNRQSSRKVGRRRWRSFETNIAASVLFDHGRPV